MIWITLAMVAGIVLFAAFGFLWLIGFALTIPDRREEFGYWQDDL